MDHRLSCEIVKDLLPSYIEGLTSEVTNQEIENHLANCEECSLAYNQMKIPIETPLEAEPLDYLKKVKQRTNKKIITVVAMIAAFFLVLVGIRVYLVGVDSQGVANYYPLMSSTMQGEDVLVIQGELGNRSRVFKKFQVSTEGDVATIQLIERYALPWENDNAYYVGYQIPNGIKQIVFNDYVVWEKGVLISKETNELYKTKHDYIGEMPANARTAKALNLSRFGSYLNKLETTKQPYGWIFQFSTIIKQEDLFNERFTQYAYVILSLIGNADKISWEYNNGSELVTKTVTTEEATRELGSDIKAYSNSLSDLQGLLDQLFL